MVEHNELLNDLYYKQHNYDGVVALYKKAKRLDRTITMNTVEKWLDKQQTNKITKIKVSKNIYLPIYSEMNYSFQIDLTFIPQFKQENRGYYILFTAININTRFVYVYKAKDKKTETILDLLKRMMKETVINSITVDSGGEFINRQFKKFCEDNNIELFEITNDSHKLGIINRFHRTFKDKLNRYFISNNTTVWIKIYRQIINNYNNTINRGIGIEPIKVNDFIENEIIQEKKAINGIIKTDENVFNVGDKVRVKRKEVTFISKFSSKYLPTVYTVTSVTANSLHIEDNNNVRKIVKKSQVMKVNDEEYIHNDYRVDNDEIGIARRNNNNIRILRKEGIDENNIIDENVKRTRKRNSKYD